MGHKFAERLKDLRSERRLLQRGVEEALQLRPGTASQYERGLREPGFDLLLSFADLFDVSVDYLLGRPGAPKPSHLLTLGRERVKQAVARQSAALKALPPNERLARIVRLAGEVAPDVFALPRVARRIMVTPVALQAIVSGSRTLSPEAAAELAEYFGLERFWFMRE